MNPSTAQGKLVRDILWEMIRIAGMTSCHHCGKPMDRNTFSIEHIEPWLDSEDPVGLFFDLDNISFSHQECNIKASRTNKSPCGTVQKYNNGCRCDSCRNAKSVKAAKYYTTERRRDIYHRTGK